MKAFILFNIRAGEIADVVRHLGKIPQVKDVNMTFGPYDAVAIVHADSLDHLGKMLANEIQPIAGIEETLTCLAVDL
ncbi:MAG: Lrp/AsnC ligand binding domain-containing protein [Anaerolineales bacterium]|jgi:DNA-binding Lrp family transcriptional regulator|nr:Lrp/AsnC ligand binding domain-containing protein [Anaerolineales bacterium]